MPKNIPHNVRYPDYSIPFTQVAYPSTAHYILSYAMFKQCAFTYADHMGFRVKPIRKDMWHKAADKMVGYGWLTVDDKQYQITPLGCDACRRIAARNSCRPGRKQD